VLNRSKIAGMAMWIGLQLAGAPLQDIGLTTGSDLLPEGHFASHVLYLFSNNEVTKPEAGPSR
jgi:hypothetical protein